MSGQSRLRPVQAPFHVHLVAIRVSVLLGRLPSLIEGGLGEVKLPRPADK